MITGKGCKSNFQKQDQQKLTAIPKYLKGRRQINSCPRQGFIAASKSMSRNLQSAAIAHKNHRNKGKDQEME